MSARIYSSVTHNYGASWSAPQVISGRLTACVYVPFDHRDNYSLATETAPGSMAFAVLPVSTQQSDPTRDDRWFASTLNAAFPHPSSFVGDHSNIVVVPGTIHVLAYWTDMREQACFACGCVSGEDAYFAAVG